MSTPSEIERFLTELSGRRNRLLRLADPDPDASDQPSLLAELEELGEQLVVADEELRVQQEELDEARQQLEVLGAERRTLLRSSAQAQVVTDLKGMVRESNRVADLLVLRPSGRVTPLPIATWFDVSHRSHIRSLIGKVAAGAESARLKAVLARRSDGTAVPVSVAVFRAADPASGTMLLRWELQEITGASSLHSGPEPVVRATDGWPTDRQLLADLAALVVELTAPATVEDVCEVVARAAGRLVPGADRASVDLVPAVADPAVDDHGEAGLRVPIRPAGPQHAILSVVGDAFDEDARGVASLVAAHATAALTRVWTEQDLRAAITSRQIIGQAVGILVERLRITPDAGFDILARASSQNSIKVRDLAREMVETGQDPFQIRKT